MTRGDPLRSEASLLASVKATAKAIGLRCFHPKWSFGSEPGWPDVALTDGETLWLLELKSEQGRLSEKQRGWLEALGTCRRVVVRVVRPSDWEALRDELVKRRWG